MNVSGNDYDSLGEQPRSITPVSVYDRSIEEMQSISVVPNGYLWCDSSLRMLSEEISIAQLSTVTAQKEVERVNRIRKAVGLRRLLKKWREEDDEEERQEILEYTRLDLGEGGL